MIIFNRYSSVQMHFDGNDTYCNTFIHYPFSTTANLDGNPSPKIYIQLSFSTPANLAIVCDRVTLYLLFLIAASLKGYLSLLTHCSNLYLQDTQRHQEQEQSFSGER